MNQPSADKTHHWEKNTEKMKMGLNMESLRKDAFCEIFWQYVLLGSTVGLKQ